MVSAQVVPFDCSSSMFVELMETSHPLPNAATFASTAKQLESLAGAPKGTLLIALLSGGGSSLFESTAGSNISLEEVRLMNKLLIESGASIAEISPLKFSVRQRRPNSPVVCRYCP